MWYVIGIIAALSVPFTLWWWKDADRWARAEHKRFKPRTQEPVERVVVQSHPTARVGIEADG